MNEMVERVAQAIRGGNVAWEWQDFEDEARRVIAAMREPTEAMLEAGYNAPVKDVRNLGEWKLERLRGDWNAMIDAALKD